MDFLFVELLDKMIEDITKDFLIKNGFRKEYENIFAYSNKEYIIDVILYNEPLYHNRHWKIIIFSSTRYMIGNNLIQTVEQFKKVMEIYDIDLNYK